MTIQSFFKSLLCLTLGLSTFANPLAGENSKPAFSLLETFLVLPQVDYEGAIYYRDSDPLPHLDFEKVHLDKVVEKQHRAVTLENEYLRVTVLPEMGRVYSMVFKPTGHETLWQNDVVVPGRANNETGWWLWLGGIEYTLPKDEHGTTWALPWDYKILEDSPKRKALSVEVTEPGTGLRETITFSLFPGVNFLEAQVVIENPGTDPVEFAHWVNPMWVPGGENELTDGTEFIVPTKRILVEERWQANLGPSPQPWPGNPLRFIRTWKMGDIMADGLESGFFGAYSHEAEEGVVRIFDPIKNPGVDIWTYGFHPGNIPTGSGAPNKGYVEMWGGTVKHFPNELKPLDGGARLEWTEWIYPFRRTEGLTFANENAAVHFSEADSSGKITVNICPTRSLRNALVEVRARDEVLLRDTVDIAPTETYRRQIQRMGDQDKRDLSLVLSADNVELVTCRAAD